MGVIFKVKMNEKLYLRDPDQSALGQKILKSGVDLIVKIGFEEFTFKKLAAEIETTEAGIYRYFENKHRLLVYIINWYWSCLEYKVVFSLNNMKNAEMKLKKIVELLASPSGHLITSESLNEKQVYHLVMLEGSKAYLTRNVTADNKDHIFKPYKDLCAKFSSTILEYNPNYKFSHSLASTLIEVSHSQKFFMKHLPSLTDFGKEKDDKNIILFLESVLFGPINRNRKKQ